MISSRPRPPRGYPPVPVCAVWSTILLGCLLPAGCSKPDYKLVLVSSRVTVNGKGVADINVSFQPSQEGKAEPGPGSFGRTDAEGRYSLKTVQEPPVDGAVVGTHVVTFRAGAPESLKTDEAVAPAVILPMEALRGLPFEVPAEGTDQADFHLNSP
jgi:hypothetical protein